MRRVHVSALVGLLGVMVLSVAAAWGCVPQPFLSIGPRASGPAGTEVTVDGTDFGSGSAEIRWNGVQGPLLGEATESEFSLTVTVPEAPVGLYLIMGLTRDGNGNVIQKGATSFEVTDAVGATPPSPAAIAGVGRSESADDDGLSGGAMAGIAVGALAMATVGGLVGAAASSRRARSTATAHGADSS